MRPDTRTAFLVTITVALVTAAYAAEKPPDASKPALKAPRKMRMNEPMATEMMKEGMKKGDVKGAANRRTQEMQPMMEQEEKSMPQSTGKPAK